MDKWQAAFGHFGYELASGLLVGLVLKGTLSKAAATGLISDCLDYLSEERPDLREELQRIAAKGTAQVEMLSIEAERKR